MRDPRPRRAADPTVGERPWTRLERGSLLALLLAGVIAVTAGLVAASLLPAALPLAAGVSRIGERLGPAPELPSLPHLAERSTIYARDGETVLATVHLGENRTLVALEDVSRAARDAVLAIEDDDFYEHGGLDPWSVARALVANLVAGDVVQGGSTITQQLVKNLYIRDPAQTFARKFREAALALRLEQEFSKDQILEWYLNQVYLGHGVYGLGTAAQYYFGRPAARLTLPQGALLAGMIASPETYDPVDRPEAALARRNQVLDRLAELGWVPRERVERAKARGLGVAAQATSPRAGARSFLVDYVVRELLDPTNDEFDVLGEGPNQRRRALARGGFEIRTTFEPAWDRYAAAAVRTHLPDPRGPDAAVVSVDTRTGAIRAMFSGRDYARAERPLDLVTSARQPGSAFKPFTLVAAFRQGVPPGKVYPSRSPYRDPRWDNACHCVTNAEGAGDRGYLDLWAATRGSVNVVFAQLALDVGAEAIVQAAHDLGITAPLDPVPSITLGAEEASPLDMAAAFAVFANEGVRCEPFAIARVVGPDGTVLYRHRPECERVLDSGIANLVTAMLQGVVRSGTGTAASLGGRPVAGKTGTTQDYTNVWFVGYTRQVSTAVWVGFPEGQRPMDTYFGGPVFGGTHAAPIWRDFMTAAVAGMPVVGFPAPPPAERGEVPEVVGLRRSGAEAALTAAGFTPRAVKVDSVEPRGTVVSQDPAAGASAILGSLVTVQVSTGIPPKAEVPDVLGLAEEEAAAQLTTAGFVVTVEYRTVANPAKDGIVLAQSPEPGAKIRLGEAVTITVGQPPPPDEAAPG